MQDTAANCGPAGMSNALAALGIARSQAECEALAKTTAAEGTSPAKLLRGLKSLEGVRPVVLKETRQDVALLRLDKALRYGRPVILLVDDGQHWVAAIGQLGERYLVADGADNELVLSLDMAALAARWIEDERTYYGVIL